MSEVLKAEVVESTSLALPEAGEPITADWWQTHALPYFDGEADVAHVLEDTRRVDALARYVKDRKQRSALNKARIVGEMRVGELDIAGNSAVTAAVPEKQYRLRFRTLAKHRKQVIAMLQTIDSRERILARLERKKRTTSDSEEVGAEVELREGDFRMVLDDLAGEVDVILTDPPYPKEYLPLYSDLSVVGERLLRPGGVLVAMVGHAHLPEVLQRLGESLVYRWTVAYLTGGAAATVFPRRVQTYWKPLVVFEKPPANPDHRIGGDVIRAGGNDRDDTVHHWGQTEHGMAQIVERLTAADDLVVDPFAGGGTTLAVCQRLGRPSIGAEIDPAAAASARERLGL